MIQALIKKGKVIGERIPTPKVNPGNVLIQVVNSCISAGTELTSVANTKKSLITRALEQPEQVKAVFDFAKNNGIEKTIEKIKGQIDIGKPTGYSIAGIVIAVGEDVKEFEIGDRVAAAGAGLANHAAFVDIPENLVMKMPNDMSFELASTVTLGGIAMQGVRRCELQLGETCVIVGAGILGLLALQMLKLSGVRTIVTDLDSKRLNLAKILGADIILNPTQDDAFKIVENFTGGYGADCVLFTAATSSSEPLSQCFKMCKRKGRVVLVGVVGMDIKREDMYAKELDFLISTSYGPGRYDKNYEEKGLNYPFAYVRWTENRNMTEYLRLVHEGLIDVSSLISATYAIEEVEKAFEALQQPEKPIIVLLSYDQKNTDDQKNEFKISIKKSERTNGVVNIALIGAGAFATGMHLPNLKSLSSKYKLKAVMNRTGSKGKAVAEQFGADYATTNFEDILQDKDIDLVLIATRHDSHAAMTLQALKAGKHVFVEKPLAINQELLDEIKKFYLENPKDAPILFVGYNRRFSNILQEIKKHTSQRINPLFVHYRMNAGYLPKDHWVHEDGGRIIGECCHIIDVMNFLTESRIKSISTECLSPTNEKYSSTDNKQILLKYEDGSVCSIHYFAVGNKEIPKEFLEVHFDEKTITMEDYKKLKGYGIKLKDCDSSIPQKGQLEELSFLYESIQKKNSFPIALWDLFQTAEISFLI